MSTFPGRILSALILLLVAAPASSVLRAEEDDAPLPPGVQAVWDLSRAWHETTATRERICLNGLWRWQPAADRSESVPTNRWGFFKVPGAWPGITDYMQKDGQTVFTHPAWTATNLARIDAAWYERTFTVPAAWSGRRIALSLAYLNSLALVCLDGRKVGEIQFPAGELDLTRVCRPGETHRLSLLVLALPLKGVLVSYTDSASAREVKGSVARRGLCGDVFLVGTPIGPRLTGVKVATSVRRAELTLEARVAGLDPGSACSLQGRIRRDGTEVRRFEAGAPALTRATNDTLRFVLPWKPESLWDLPTPDHQFDLDLTLRDGAGQVLDVHPPVRFGFREFWIDGRDFYLNGTRIHLSALPLDNAQIGPQAATYAAARESLERLRTLGINFVYTHNYDANPGAHLAFDEILRAADDLGMLVALTQPHFSHYDWSGADAERTNGYARHAAFYAGVAGNHPSVVMYSTSHNATGYNEDMDPDLIDGRYDRRDPWAANNVRKALRAEALIRSADPSRPVYHHASGNLGIMHCSNFYPNFAPVQELSDWFEHWATDGVKPLFLCEYGAPFTWDWAMYRGWYQGKREFGSAAVPWEFCLAEWNAQFYGDAAFPISEAERQNLRWEARQWRTGRGWHRWDYPHSLGSTVFTEREAIFARYYTENWRAFRTWGVSANSPWEHDPLFKLRPGMNRNQRTALPVNWTDLQRPGYSPDYLGERYERMDLAYERSDWLPTLAATALRRNNGPLLGYIAGKPSRFTSQDHLFVPGESVEKQLVVINDSRRTVTCDGSWTVSAPGAASGQIRFTLETGEQRRVPVRFDLPADAPAGAGQLTAQFRFDPGEAQSDTFSFQILPRPQSTTTPTATTSRPRAPRLFDPVGRTAELLRRLGVPFEPIAAEQVLQPEDLLIVGREALTVRGAHPALSALRDGLRVLVFEQTADALEQRLGFRVAEYGLRQVFPRVPDHPVLAGLGVAAEAALRDWRGTATLLPARLKTVADPKFNGAPTVTWCGMTVTRLWRCGNQGNVASVLIEKPACGDFRPLLDGGFSLQYSPLLEYRDGRGLMIFCQLDVTGRSEADPAADAIARRLIDFVSAWQPGPEPRGLVYAGEPAGLAHLRAAGMAPRSFTGTTLNPATDGLVLGPAAGSMPTPAEQSAVRQFLRDGGRVVAVGLSQAEAGAWLPDPVTMNAGEHLSTAFTAPPADSFAAGLGPADTHLREPRAMALVTGGASQLGDGVLAASTNARVIFCQIVPWRFEDQANPGLRRTFRRTSVVLSRLLGNQGIASATPLATRWSAPVGDGEPGRWLKGLYLDTPEPWDDPYRFFRW